MSAFALFSLQSPSRLVFDKQRVEGNLGTIDGIGRVPCDTPMRELLDPVSPESVRPVFKSLFRQLQRGKALEPLAFLDDHSLLCLDGTEYFTSKTIHCASCLHKVHRNGSITYSHQMLGAAIVHPDVRAVIPLMPEPIVKHDGATKNAPHIQTLQDHHLHYILGVKEGDHAFLFKQVQTAEQAGHVTYYERHDRAAGVVHRFRFINDVPLNESHTDVRVNFIEYWERGDDQVQHFSWVTDLRVNQRNVFH